MQAAHLGGALWKQSQGVGETGKEEADKRNVTEQVIRLDTWGSIQPGTSGRRCTCVTHLRVTLHFHPMLDEGGSWAIHSNLHLGQGQSKPHSARGLQDPRGAGR